MPTLYAFEKHNNVESYLIDSDKTNIVDLAEKL